MAGRTSLTVHEGMVGMAENVFINVHNRSLSITADVTIPDGGGEGTIIAQGGRFGGWSLHLKDHKPVYTYNFLGMQRFTIAGAQPLAAGRATIRYDFAYEAAGLAPAEPVRCSSTEHRSCKAVSSEHSAVSSGRRVPMSVSKKERP